MGVRRERESKRERGDLHLHLHTPQQASPSQPGHHGTFPVTGGGSRPHIAVNQSDCCNLRNPHFPAGSSCSQMLCAKQGLVRNHVPHAARTSVFEVVTIQTRQFRREEKFVGSECRRRLAFIPRIRDEQYGRQ